MANQRIAYFPIFLPLTAGILKINKNDQNLFGPCWGPSPEIKLFKHLLKFWANFPPEARSPRWM